MIAYHSNRHSQLPHNLWENFPQGRASQGFWGWSARREGKQGSFQKSLLSIKSKETNSNTIKYINTLSNEKI